MTHEQRSALGALFKQLDDLARIAKAASKNAKRLSTSFGVTSREASKLDPIMLTTEHVSEQMTTARRMIAELIPGHPSKPPTGQNPIEEK